MKRSLTLLCATALVASGCSVTSATHAAGGKCVTDSDCNSPLVCSANACVDLNAGTTGGATDGSDGSVATSAGASSGSSSGSSSGLSGGSSAGASSGSTSGTAPATALIRFINASPKTSGGTALDLCVRDATATTFTNGLEGATGVAYSAAGDFKAVDKASVNLRVVAAGSDCSTALYDYPLVVDMTDGGSFTAVAYGDETTAVIGMLVIETAAPSPSTLTHITAIEVVANDDGVTLSTPLPFQPFAAGVHAGAAVVDDTFPFTDTIFAISSATSVFTFSGVTLAANAQTTIVVLGDATGTGAKVPELLVCSDTATTGGCTVIPNTPLAYARVVNADPTQTLRFCIAPHTLPATASTVLTPATALNVSAFIPTTASATGTGTFDVAVVSGTTCTAGDLATALAKTTTPAMPANVYFTFAYTPSVTHGDPVGGPVTAAIAVIPTLPGAADGSTAFTAFDGALSDDDTLAYNFEPVMPVRTLLYGEPLVTAALDYGAFATTAIPLGFNAVFNDQPLHFATGDSGGINVADIAFTPGQPTSLWLLGDFGTAATGTVIICTDDGTNICTTHPTIYVDPQPAYVRVVNLSQTAATVCLGTTVVPTASLIPFGTVTGFSPQTAGSATFTTTNGADCTGTLTNSLTVTLTADAYHTVYLSGNATKALTLGKTQTPIVNGNHPSDLDASGFSPLAFNGWQSTTAGVGNVTVPTVPGKQLKPTLNYKAFTTPVTAEALLSNLPGDFTFVDGAGNTWTFPLPTSGDLVPVGTGTYDAFIAGAAGATSDTPTVLWCSSQFPDATGNAECVTLDGTFVAP